MARVTYPIVEKYVTLVDGDGGEAALGAAFANDAPDGIDGEALFATLRDAYEGEELGEVAAETILTLKAECDADDFHNWDYDHLSTIIELSNSFGFKIPRNLVNGLPEQLIILVDHSKLGQPGCD